MFDRIAGCLYGLAAGDRNGGPLRMALLLGESLVELQRLDEGDVARRYLHWWQNGAFDTGPTFAAVYQRVAKGTSVPDAVLDAHVAVDGQTAGVNSAHRCPPLALAGFIPDDQLETALRAEARLSHLHELAGETAAAVGLMCRHLVRGISFDEALRMATTSRSNLLRRVATITDEDALRTGGFAPEAFVAGVYFARTAQTFREALHRSVEFAGPANYCPVITGALAGARWGRQAISEDDLRHCPVLNEVGQLAICLQRTWLAPEEKP